MVEIGESSGAKASGEIWATLASLDSRCSVVELRSKEVVIYSEISPSSSDKLEWCKIERNDSQCSATIQNLSSNVILVDGATVQKGGAVEINGGSKILAGPSSEGYLSYKFEVMPAEESCKQQLKICMDVEHAKCSICLNIWHDVVTVAPCLHNFCNGCFSEWLRRTQESHKTVLCPQCRAVVQFVGRNHFLHTITEDILKSDMTLKRSEEETALLNSYASIQSNLVISTRRRQGRKRARTPLDEQSDDMELLCPQCGSDSSGFRCNQSTLHLQCQACGGMMPSRSDLTIPQHCLGCDRAFCGAYWYAQRIGDSRIHPLCSHETLKPIKDRTISGIPPIVHESNRHEQDITERSIRQMGRTVQDVISEWIIKLNNREIDRTRMGLNHAEMITSATHVLIVMTNWYHSYCIGFGFLCLNIFFDQVQ